MAEAATFGSLVLAVLAGPAARLPPPSMAFAALFVTSVAWLVVQSTVMSGVDAPSAVWLVVRETWVGHVAVVRFALWGVAYWLSRRGRSAAAGFAAIAMALHAAFGHAAAGDDGWLFASVLVHVLTAGAWIGSLPRLWQRLGDPAPKRLLARYGWMGGACVLVIAGTGALQGWRMAGGVSGLVGTDYGRLLLIKLVGFAALVGFAWRNQFWLVRGLLAGLGALRRAVLCEAALGVVVLVAASGLAGVSPGAHEQPIWPFGYRVTLAPFAEDLLADEAWLGIALSAAAGFAWLTAVAWRSWIPVVAGASLLGLAVPHLALL